MSEDPGPAIPYDIRVRGHLDDHWSSWFDGATLTREPSGTTVLHCLVSDQAGLHGLLAKLRDLGAVLLSVGVVQPVDGFPDPAEERGPSGS